MLLSSMHPVLGLMFVCLAAQALPVGFLAVETDELPVEVYVDNRLVPVDSEGVVVEVSPGRHFVSLFPPKKVYQAYRDETPDQFWTAMRRDGAVSESRRLVSSYEMGAVREGTKWVYAEEDDTISVRLSVKKAMEKYRRDSSCVLGTFLGWTLLIGMGMVVSLILAKLQ